MSQGTERRAPALGRILCPANPAYKDRQLGHAPGVYALLTTDIGRFCRKALMSASFIFKPPL